MRGFEEESWTGAESLFDLQSIQNQVKTLFRSKLLDFIWPAPGHRDVGLNKQSWNSRC